MKKRYIFIAILAVFIVAVGIFAYMNADNIKAIYKATKYNTEEIQKEIEEKEKKNSEMLAQYNQNTITPLSEEDAKKLTSGEISEEEAIELILGKTKDKTEENPPAQSGQTGPGTETQLPSAQTGQTGSGTEIQSPPAVDTSAVDDKLGELIAKVYVLKGKYNQFIADENHNAASNFYSLPKEEQTKEKKYEMGLDFMRNVLKLQDQCDAEIEVILTEMTTLLTDNNMSVELVDEIRKSYEEEKELKKAYFVNKYTE